MEDIKDIVLEYVKEEYLEDEDEELTYETPVFWRRSTASLSPTKKPHPRPLTRSARLLSWSRKSQASHRERSKPP